MRCSADRLHRESLELDLDLTWYAEQKLCDEICESSKRGRE